MTQVSAVTTPDPEMGKKDVDILSDAKLIAAIEETPKALYVKLADRIHNLRTIKVFSYAKQKEKAQHTRNILIPLAKRMGVFRLADTLEELCFQIENPDRYKIVSESYEKLLDENRYAVKEVQDYLTDLFFSSVVESNQRSDWSNFISSCSFWKRNKNSIFNRITSNVKNIVTELESNITKKKLALYDVYFIVRDECTVSAQDVFFSYYPEMQSSRLRLTIVAIYQSTERGMPCYLLEDCYHVQYRLFIAKQQEYINRTHGIILNGNSADIRLGRMDMADPSEVFERYINVYRKDGTMVQIREGATVPDFAFSIHAEIGLCAKYGLLNNKQEQIPLYMSLREGDQVEIVHDADKDHPENNIPHATIRWFEYVRTREATRALSRYLEIHVESSRPLIPVRDDEGNVYELETGSTVLDFAFLVGENVGLHFKAAYVNSSKEKAAINKMLRYNDKVRFEYDENDRETPKFEWMNVVRTQKAKDILIQYFSELIKKN